MSWFKKVLQGAEDLAKPAAKITYKFSGAEDIVKAAEDPMSWQKDLKAGLVAASFLAGGPITGSVLRAGEREGLAHAGEFLWKAPVGARMGRIEARATSAIRNNEGPKIGSEIVYHGNSRFAAKNKWGLDYSEHEKDASNTIFDPRDFKKPKYGGNYGIGFYHGSDPAFSKSWAGPFGSVQANKMDFANPLVLRKAAFPEEDASKIAQQAALGRMFQMGQREGVSHADVQALTENEFNRLRSGGAPYSPDLHHSSLASTRYAQHFGDKIHQRMSYASRQEARTPTSLLGINSLLKHSGYDSIVAERYGEGGPMWEMIPLSHRLMQPVDARTVSELNRASMPRAVADYMGQPSVDRSALEHFSGPEVPTMLPQWAMNEAEKKKLQEQLAAMSWMNDPQIVGRPLFQSGATSGLASRIGVDPFA